MIKDKKAWEKFERELRQNTKADYNTNLSIFEELLAYAKLLGKFPPDDPLEGIEIDFKIARILNSVK
jgi:hypothetical protein